jgi:hypothetical protein
VRVLKRGPLSDHAPLLVTVSARAAGPAG